MFWRFWLWKICCYETEAMAATSPWPALYFVGLSMFGKHTCGHCEQPFHQLRSSSSPTKKTASQTSTRNIASLNPNQDCSLSRSGPCSRSLNLSQKVLRWCKEHEEVLGVVSTEIHVQVILLSILLRFVTFAMEMPGIHPTSMEWWILNMSL